MLIEMSWIHSIPTVQFCDGSQMNKPIHLDSFPEITRRMSRNPTAYFLNPTEFCRTFRIFFRHTHFICQVCMPVGEQDSCITRNGHCLQLFLFIGSFRIIHKVE